MLVKGKWSVPGYRVSLFRLDCDISLTPYRRSSESFRLCKWVLCIDVENNKCNAYKGWNLRKVKPVKQRIMCYPDTQYPFYLFIDFPVRLRASCGVGDVNEIRGST